MSFFAEVTVFLALLFWAGGATYLCFRLRNERDHFQGVARKWIAAAYTREEDQARAWVKEVKRG